jgi:hypothetical protein
MAQPKSKPTKQTIWIEVTSRSGSGSSRATSGKSVEMVAAKKSGTYELTSIKKSAAATKDQQILPLVKVDLGKSVAIKPQGRAKLGHMKHLGLKLDD